MLNQFLDQYFKSNFNFARVSCNFLNQIRKLLVPVLMGLGLLVSASAKANYEFDSLSNTINLNSAKIYFSGKKPLSLGGFSDYTIEELSLHPGYHKYLVLDGPTSPSVVVSLTDLDRVSSGAKTKFVFSYYLSPSQAIIEGVACWRGFYPWIWSTYSPTFACLEKVARFAWQNQTEELELSSPALVSAINDSIQKYNEDKNNFLKNLNNLIQFPYNDNAGQIERNQFKYILIKATQDYFKNDSSLLVDAVAKEFIVKKITNKLQESDEAFSEVLHAFESIDCNRRLKNQFSNMGSRFYHELYAYVANICSYNEHSFLERIAQISPSMPVEFDDSSSVHATDLGYKAFVFCNKYICEFKLKRGLSYRVVVSKANNIKNIKNYVVGVVDTDINQGCNDFCDISDVDALIPLFTDQSVSWAVSKIDPFKFLKNTQENYNLTDGDYRISFLKPSNIPNSEEILKLSNNQYKVFYWSRANKNVFYKYDPRFFDSRYIVSVPSNPKISAVFNDILNTAKQTGSNIVSLSLLHEENLDCFSSFSSCMSDQYYKGSTKNSGGATIRELDNAIKNDVSVDYIIAGDLVHIPRNGVEYCRIPQAGNNGDLNMPLKKDSESDFIANMKEIDLRVICFTVDVSDTDEASRSMMLDNIIEKFESMRVHFNFSRTAIDVYRNKKAFDYAIDCNPLDATVHVEENITHCPQPGAKITYFLAIPKAGHPNFAHLLKEQSIKEYLEIAPWGNLQNAVVDREFMFRNSTIEGVQLNTASTTTMSYMFADSDRLENGNFKFWDTSNVTNMEGMFNGASSFNQNIKNWNLSNLKFLQCMFNEALDNFKHESIVVKDHWYCPQF